jgi:hypothetical protein
MSGVADRFRDPYHVGPTNRMAWDSTRNRLDVCRTFWYRSLRSPTNPKSFPLTSAANRLWGIVCKESSDAGNNPHHHQRGTQSQDRARRTIYPRRDVATTRVRKWTPARRHQSAAEPGASARQIRSAGQVRVHCSLLRQSYLRRLREGRPGTGGHGIQKRTGLRRRKGGLGETRPATRGRSQDVGCTGALNRFADDPRCMGADDPSCRGRAHARPLHNTDHSIGQ